MSYGYTLLAESFQVNERPALAAAQSNKGEAS
jgi:hypothetical protein